MTIVFTELKAQPKNTDLELEEDLCVLELGRRQDEGTFTRLAITVIELEDQILVSVGPGVHINLAIGAMRGIGINAEVTRDIHDKPRLLLDRYLGQRCRSCGGDYVDVDWSTLEVRLTPLASVSFGPIAPHLVELALNEVAAAAAGYLANSLPPLGLFPALEACNVEGASTLTDQRND